jgi:hypothetical protein
VRPGGYAIPTNAPATARAAEDRSLSEPRCQGGRSGLVEIIWEFVAKDEARGQFELAYSPGSAWGLPFAGHPGSRPLLCCATPGIHTGIWRSTSTAQQPSGPTRRCTAVPGQAEAQPEDPVEEAAGLRALAARAGEPRCAGTSAARYPHNQLPNRDPPSSLAQGRKVDRSTQPLAGLLQLPSQ